MKTKPKQELYKTAYSHLYEEYVKIIKARLVKGTYIYDCKISDGSQVMFSEHELNKYSL
jgi:hypothetical protein